MRYSSRAEKSNSIFSGAVTAILRFFDGGAEFLIVTGCAECNVECRAGCGMAGAVARCSQSRCWSLGKLPGRAGILGI